MKKRIENLTVYKNTGLISNYILLELQSNEPFEKIIPGQFVEIFIPDCKDTFLRRPISIFDVDIKKNILKFLIKIVGCGTETLSRLKKGSFLNLIYPLGNGFSMPLTDKVLFAGGGYGIAPFFYFAKILNQKNIKPVMLFGSKTASDFILKKEFAGFGNLNITTEDDTEGIKGMVTDHPLLNDKNPSFEMIYACGPEPMMKAVAKFAKNKNIECEVSLDNLMACGIGACLCCVTETIRGNELVCTKGPVFNIKELKWQI